MPTFRQTFAGAEPEDFPVPPIARRLLPGDVVEYEADEPIAHVRLESADEPPVDWDRLTHPWSGAAVVRRAPEADESTQGQADESARDPELGPQAPDPNTTPAAPAAGSQEE